MILIENHFATFDTELPGDDPVYEIYVKLGDVTILYGYIGADDGSWYAAIWAYDAENTLWSESFHVPLQEAHVGSDENSTVVMLPIFNEDTAYDAISALKGKMQSLLEDLGKLSALTIDDAENTTHRADASDTSATPQQAETARAHYPYPGRPVSHIYPDENTLRDDTPEGS